MLYRLYVSHSHFFKSTRILLINVNLLKNNNGENMSVFATFYLLPFSRKITCQQIVLIEFT